MDKKDWINGHSLNIFTGWFKMLKIRRKINSGEKTAYNYSVMAEWFGLFDFSISFARKELFYALKAIRADKTYPEGYLYAADAYSGLDISSPLIEKYCLKAIECGGDKYYLPKFVLFEHYLNVGQIEQAYYIGTEYLKHKSDYPDYWAMALYINALYYGYGLEYKTALSRYITYCIKNKRIGFTGFLIVIFSLFTVLMSLYSKKINKNTGSFLLEALIGRDNFELQLSLVNKLIIRERREKGKINPSLACLYVLKGNALVFKPDREYEKAMKALDKYYEYGDKNDKLIYYWYRANYAYCSGYYKKAFVYANEALLHKVDARTLQIKGFASNELGKCEEAVKSLKEALKYNDCDKDITYYQLCLAYYELGEYKEALLMINHALLFEQDANNYYAKANCLDALGMHKEAKICYDKYLELL